MKNLYLIPILLTCTLILTPKYLSAADPFKIVTTLSSYADIAKEIGGDLVEVSYIASPKFDPHFIEPKPSDVLKVKKCALFIHSGLDLEAWRDPLVDAAARADIRQGGERQLDLSLRIPILEVPDHSVSRSEGDIHLSGNPHYWLDPRNGVIIAEEISEKLIQLMPENAEKIIANRDSYLKKLAAKISLWQEKLAPLSGRPFVGYHNGWAYLIKFIDAKMEMFLEPKPGIPPTPKQIEGVIAYVKEKRVPALIQSAHNPSDAADAVSTATGARTLTLSQGVGDIEEAKSYIEMFDYDVAQLQGVINNG